MATPAIPSLSWTCQQCGQQVPAGQANCPNYAAGAGASPPPAPRPLRSRPAPAGGLTRNKKIALGVAGGIVVVFLISLLVWGGGSPSRKPPAPPPKLQPQAQQQQQQLATPPPAVPTKPSPMAPAPATTSVTPPPVAKSARTSAVQATANSQELVRELRRINSRLGEINRRIPAEQAGATVKALGEITWLLEQERQTASTSKAPPAQPRRERLSDRELERRYKERLLSQEPQRQEE